MFWNWLVCLDWGRILLWLWLKLVWLLVWYWVVLVFVLMILWSWWGYDCCGWLGWLKCVVDVVLCDCCWDSWYGDKCFLVRLWLWCVCVDVRFWGYFCWCWWWCFCCIWLVCFVGGVWLYGRCLVLNESWRWFFVLCGYCWRLCVIDWILFCDWFWCNWVVDFFGWCWWLFCWVILVICYWYWFSVSGL